MNMDFSTTTKQLIPPNKVYLFFIGVMDSAFPQDKKTCSFKIFVDGCLKCSYSPSNIFLPKD